MKPHPRVCIVGAGSSGIAVAKTLWDRGIPFTCYEASDRVGGNWVFKNKNGLSAAYRSLHINTSRDRMQYPSFAMPASYPDFPGHELIAAYFERYVDHFGFRHRIRFETPVAAVRRDRGAFAVTTATGETELFDAVVVANGHHWDPSFPDPPFPGTFDGLTMHSHAYIDPSEPHELVGKRVVVLGMGNSAMDIACELSRPGVSERVFLASRRGAHVIPHYLFGRPLDQLFTKLPPWLPFSVSQTVGKVVMGLSVGPVERYGLPRPDHDLGSAHPTISSEILPKIGKGDIVVKPNIAALEGKRVRFVDGSVEDVDAIVYCTGYKVTFPFFEPGYLDAKDNELPLFRRLLRPDRPGVYFAGLLQPLGAIMPIAEAQGALIAEHLLGEYALPPDREVWADIEDERARMRARYVASKRHTMQVDFDEYLWRLERERRAGRARARAAGHPLPIEPRAHTLSS